MKELKFLLIFMLALVGFYFGAIFLGFNLPKPAFLQKGITGEATLEVKIVMDNTSQDPVSHVEVDVAEKPGPPPEGGVAATDEKGVAVFKIKPGNYVVYFNNVNFPRNLSVPQPKPVTVTQEGVNQLTIQVSTAR